MQITRKQLGRIIREEAFKVWTPAVSGAEYKALYASAKEIVMGMDKPWDEACELFIQQLRDDLSQGGYDDDDGRFG